MPPPAPAGLAMSHPPAYTEELLQPDGNAPRTSGDHVPDDFKWSDVVAECAIDIRHAFLRRVYSILMVQILATSGICALVMFNESFNHWALTHPWALWVSMFGSFGAMIAAMWKQKVYPYNLALLGLFTVFEGYLIGMVSATYDTRVVIQAALVTALVFGGLTVFALQTKYDFSGLAPYLCAGLFALLGFGFISMFLHSSGIEMAYSIIAVVIFSGFVLVDTQDIMARYDPESEVAAAITLYLDVINLFLNLLRILNGSDDN